MPFSSSTNSPATLPMAAPGQTNRLFWRWWRKQSPSQQDRYATLGPLVSVLLFLAAIIAAFWYLRNEELEREQESVKRDTEVVQQQIRLRLIENQEQLLRLGREISIKAVTPEQFMRQAGDFVRARPEVISVSWVQADESVKAARTTLSLPLDPGQAIDMDPLGGRTETYDPLHMAKEPQSAFKLARDRGQPIYSKPYANQIGGRVIQVHVPLMDRSGFIGTVVTEYSLESLLRYLVPREVASRHAMGLIQADGDMLTSTVGGDNGTSVKPTFIYDVIVTPVGNGLMLRGMGFRTSSNLIGNTLFWMVVALSALTVWTLMGTLRHMRRRSQIQKTLVQETNFRRAMENSMLTGMRTIDLEGRITYVNPAFCAMTGFSEEELIGCVPPYPYWPKDRLDEFNRMFQQELLGRSPMGGIEVVMQRRDGSQFDARMYVSPLIDAQGDQTGWMTSVTNITEAKRVRDQLTAAHERFTTVLEGLDAAVSVVSVQRGELLFANRSYRLWFGANPDAHTQLTGGEIMPDEIIDGDESVDHFGGLPTQALTNAGSDTREVFMDSVQKWFDVRARYVQWTDGHLAQMLIATDITARKQAEEAAARQAEKSQFTSRLITMGEMASTVAHELNQPLAAISNYCSGMISRVQSGSIDTEQLVGALEKTSRQAQRAGQIIHRIRQFVKRSEPQRQPSKVRDITDAVLELAVFEMKRRRVTLNASIANRLPILMADPILIEQVLLNLLKNAAEAIDSSQMPQSRRIIDLRVQQKKTEEQGPVVEFSVSDGGPGMKEEILARLFEAFHSTKAEGLGIGLSLCRSIIESHHGRIKAENIYNEDTVVGCRFTFTLPIDSGSGTDFEDTVTTPSNDLLADNP
ncbi:MAG TPA: PAS domain S-box protein [Aquabacterium sp.]|uniref:PAS domain S-box protein n=1 Tax=Aquabacterium sp. TaxID=1872578 RepID=UPI002E3073CE|nr:PAS domain S-box protein [Aquabacterium sp.]HEX5358185.1 PAS domain S-box protein [Aquabacterium sp.]